MPDLRPAAEAVFREQSGKILASLIRMSGSFDLAEEALQEAFASAMQAWASKGIPSNPAAWIMTAAQRKLIDAVRRERTRLEHRDRLAYEMGGGEAPPALAEGYEASDDMTFPDDRLRLIFTCLIRPASAGSGRSAPPRSTPDGST